MPTNSKVFYFVFASKEEAVDINKIDIHHTTYMAHINTTYFGER